MRPLFQCFKWDELKNAWTCDESCFSIGFYLKPKAVSIGLLHFTSEVLDSRSGSVHALSLCGRYQRKTEVSFNFVKTAFGNAVQTKIRQHILVPFYLKRGYTVTFGCTVTFYFWVYYCHKKGYIQEKTVVNTSRAFGKVS